MTDLELDSILERHLHWLCKDCEGCETMRADLSDVDLSDVDLSGAYLPSADLHGVCLKGADLYGADLCGANLKGADLTNTDLSEVDLRGADLTNADLRGATMCGTDLEYANISGSFLDEEEQCRFGTVLDESTKGYKKTAEGNVIELKIPKGAIVFSINNNKCRTNKAVVIKCEGVQHSMFDPEFEYREGDEIEIDDFNTQYNVECGKGIHFFRTKEESENYRF